MTPIPNSRARPIDALTISTRALDHPGYLGDEYAAIGQSGEEVELRHPLELTFGLLASRNLTRRREQEIPSAEGSPANREFDPEQPPILCPAAPIERLRRPGSRLLHLGQQGLARVRRVVLEQIPDRLSQQLVARISARFRSTKTLVRISE